MAVEILVGLSVLVVVDTTEELVPVLPDCASTTEIPLHLLRRPNESNSTPMSILGARGSKNTGSSCKVSRRIYSLFTYTYAWRVTCFLWLHSPSEKCGERCFFVHHSRSRTRTANHCGTFLGTGSWARPQTATTFPDYRGNTLQGTS